MPTPAALGRTFWLLPSMLPTLLTLLLSFSQVASYMRAVLRTLAQCHTQCILHRDIKPGNFMLLTEAEDAPLKAIGEMVCMRVEGGGVKER